jgi:hypothetical protein
MAAIEALQKSDSMDPSRHQAYNNFFLALAHWRLGDRDRAYTDYDRAVAWMERNDSYGDELNRFRDEAATLLGLADLPADVFARP